MASSTALSAGQQADDEHPTMADVAADVAAPVALRWTRRDAPKLAGMWALLAMTLAALSVAAHVSPEFPGDEGLTVLIQRIQFPPLAHFIIFSSDATWPAPAGYTALAIIVALLLLRQFSTAIATAVASFGADLANVTLNGLVARPRPNNVHIHVVAHLGLHSFPSGHVTHVIALYGFLLYLTIRYQRAYPRWLPFFWIVRVVCLYFMICIGPARVLTGEHWPSDVLASYLLAGLMLVIAIALHHLLLREFARLRHWIHTRKVTA